jgi:hypothetical protein
MLFLLRTKRPRTPLLNKSIYLFHNSAVSNNNYNSINTNVDDSGNVHNNNYRNNVYLKNIPEPPTTHRVTKSIICFRHGDRSASHNLFEPDSELAIQEALAWSLELPLKAQVKELNKLAPIERSKSTLLPRDAELGVFGKLTVKGIKQAHTLGTWLGKQYITKQTLPFPNQDIISCYSSNYSRTIMSAQSVLKAMIGPTLLDGNKIKVQVSSQENEFINVYPFLQRLQKLMYDAANKVDGSISKADKAMLPTLQILSKFLPAFAFNLRRFSWLTYQDHFHCRLGRTWPPSSNIEKSWLARIENLFNELDLGNDTYLTKNETFKLLRMLSDYVTDDDCEEIFKTMDINKNGIVTFEEFVAFCKRGFPLAYTDEMEKEMWENCENVEKHVVKRFEMWYASKEILNYAIGGLVKHINSTLLNEENFDATTKVTLISGHDITVFPLLYAVGGWSEGEDKWPSYTSAVIFELLEPVPSPNDAIKNEKYMLSAEKKYIRGFYYPGCLSETGENSEISIREVTFGNHTGNHVLGYPKRFIPLDDFLKLQECD